ncbi:MAG TPA: MucR family transcriptional regulator [Phenylobacterium sp.]|uniref:MucR family transcriptional regulator n=1 Tax=Phenylobacterium sp. TaxID=1871053 RepID=UPI002B45F20B|nr:MucR family transcriptional regulator [Phenylobacterium sp.]HKR88802.1 MucR family transcriptional regulator [Phenylobacterium sp.]HKT53065.1 MucR family transcriptional regulator [Caulobacteraceae bacterium]
MSDQIELQQIIGQVAAAYFNNNHVTPVEIPVVISNIAASLASVGAAPAALEAPSQELEQPKLTASQIRKSITQDKLISFEDGKGYKTLRRHLAAKGLTPDDYRSKWGLPKDYPMVAPAYSEARSSMAKARGFGSRPATAAPTSSQPSAAPAVAAERVQRAATTKKAATGGGKSPARRRAVNKKAGNTSEPNA